MQATKSKALRESLDLPNGARFYRCALQINPFGYLRRYKPAMIGKYDSEEEYNAAIISACKQNGIEVIGVTDHYRVKDSMKLVNSARASGLYAFSGFEAAAKDGVHFLCLFDTEQQTDLERYIGFCGIPDDESPSIGKLDSVELLTTASESWDAVCIAAHVASNGGGLLKKLSGQPRIRVWKSPYLLACALAGPVDSAPQNLVNILKNKDDQHRRKRPIAIINAQDVNDPEELANSGSSCFIKMSKVSVEGLRQAFLDPMSRIRLNSDPEIRPSVELLGMTWEGGFLDGVKLHFNENLNVLVGGRGTGKSTIIESLRYVLDLKPLTDNALKIHTDIVDNVLKNGTRISLLMRSHHPSIRCYTIERTIPFSPVVKNEHGEELPLSPNNAISGVEVFGQHELSELTKNHTRLTLLLNRFVAKNEAAIMQKTRISDQLARSRHEIVELGRQIGSLGEQLTSLPSLEETLKHFEQAGLEVQLKEKSQLIREEGVLSTITERLNSITTVLNNMNEAMPVDTAFLGAKALDGLPNAALLSKGRNILEQLSDHLKHTINDAEIFLSAANQDLEDLRVQWDKRRKATDANYEKLLRDLQRSGTDGEEFIGLQRQIEHLRPLREKLEKIKRNQDEYLSSRQTLLKEWESLRKSEYDALDRAAKKVSSKLKGRVQVAVNAADEIEPLEKLLRDKVGGNLVTAFERLKEKKDLSLSDFADRCREGKEALMKNYRLPSASAERIARANADLFMEIEEMVLPVSTMIKLNTAPEGKPETWQTLDDLSTGQKATAILLLLLLDSEAPLVVDQPEDDLDNRFIAEGIVPVMKSGKRKRQFMFATHNANIPVLGDAELILGLDSGLLNGNFQCMVNHDHMGSIDSEPVRELVEEILEGGAAAFEMRRLKYGF